MSSLAYLLIVIRVNFSKKKKTKESKITYAMLSEEFLAVWFNLFIYPTGIDRMLVMSQAFQELSPYSQKFTQQEKRETCRYYSLVPLS